MLKFAVRYQGPIAIRYPRGEAYDGLEEYREPMVYGKSELIFEGEETALLSVRQYGRDGSRSKGEIKSRQNQCNFSQCKIYKTTGYQNP